MNFKIWKWRLFVLLLCLSFCCSALWAEENKPRILLLGTGGTIVGVANQNSPTGYTAGQLTVEELVRSLPGFERLGVDLKAEQVANIASQDMDYPVWKALVERIERAAAQDEADAFVITHGTDTLEETAFFLELALDIDNPVVLVGAMRPTTSLSADGPQNLWEAIQVASSVDSFGRGVLVSFAGEIFPARYATKASTLQTGAFAPTFGGAIGFTDAHRAHYYVASAKKQRRPWSLDWSKLESLPKVEIIPVYAGAGGEALLQALERGAQGIVIAGVGDGNMPASMLQACKRAQERGVPVVRATRVFQGYVHKDHEFKDSDYGTVAAYDLSPQKARILLQLLLARGVRDLERIQAALIGDQPGALRFAEEE